MALYAATLSHNEPPLPTLERYANETENVLGAMASTVRAFDKQRAQQVTRCAKLRPTVKFAPANGVLHTPATRAPIRSAGPANGARIIR